MHINVIFLSEYTQTSDDYVNVDIFFKRLFVLVGLVVLYVDIYIYKEI